MLTVGMLKNDPLVVEAIGSPATEARFLPILDRAVRTLVRMGDIDGTMQEYCFDTCGKCIFMPPEVAAIRGVRINGAPAPIFNRVFQYLPNGPANATWCGPKSLVDKGLALSFKDPDCNLSLLVMTDECEAAGSWLRIAGADGKNTVVTENTAERGMTPYVQFDLGSSQAIFYESRSFRTFTSITKSQTKGNVYLFEYNEDELAVGALLATLHPWQTAPEYRRYQVNGIGEGEAQVVVLAKRKHTPLYHNEQAVMVDDTDAILAAVHYNRAVDNRDGEAISMYRDIIERTMSDLKRDISEGESPRVEFQPGPRLGSFRRLGGR